MFACQFLSIREGESFYLFFFIISNYTYKIFKISNIASSILEIKKKIHLKRLPFSNYEELTCKHGVLKLTNIMGNM